jgi:hypothetical protein
MIVPPSQGSTSSDASVPQPAADLGAESATGDSGLVGSQNFMDQWVDFQMSEADVPPAASLYGAQMSGILMDMAALDDTPKPTRCLNEIRE